METVPHPDSRPRIGEWLSEAFTLFGQQWQTWLLQGLIAFFVGYGPALLGSIVYYSMLFGAAIAAGGAANPNAPPSPEALGGILIGAVAAMGGSCISAFLSVYFVLGLMRTAARQLRGEAIAVRDIFGAGDAYLPALGAYILMSLGIGFGLVLCCVPGLILLGLWLFVHPLVVEGRLGVFQAFRESQRAVMPHLWMYVLWAILIVLVAYAGSFVLVGLVVTLPIAVLMLMVSYRDVFGIPGAVPPQVSAPPAPPAGYYTPEAPPAPYPPAPESPSPAPPPPGPQAAPPPPTFGEPPAPPGHLATTPPETPEPPDTHETPEIRIEFRPAAEPEQPDESAGPGEPEGPPPPGR